MQIQDYQIIQRDENDRAEVHFSGYIGHLTSDALKGERLKGLLLDSWECRVQTWTNRMELRKKITR